MFASKTTMTEIFKTATKTIDGITMYVTCCIYFVVALVFGALEIFSIHLPFHLALEGWWWILMVPFNFVTYIWLDQIPILNGRWPEVVNALILAFSCIYLLLGIFRI